MKPPHTHRTEGKDQDSSDSPCNGNNQQDHPQKQTAEKQLAAAKQHLLETARHGGISEWVHENPLEAVAVAFSAGFVSGLNPTSRLPVAELIARLLSEELLGAGQPKSGVDKERG